MLSRWCSHADVVAGRLDSDAVAAVLQARGCARAQKFAPSGYQAAREVQVLRLVARGHSNKAIAAELQLSPRTVGHHVAHVYGRPAFDAGGGGPLRRRHGLL